MDILVYVHRELLNDSYSSQIKVLHDDLLSHSGVDPTCYASLTSYCSSSVLFDGDWFCIDDSGVPEKVSSVDPCEDAGSTCK